mgnify:CR=1 FL=1
MRKVDYIQQPVRPCNFNDFYYFKNYFNDDGINKIHQMIVNGGYKFEKGGTGSDGQKPDQNYTNKLDIAYDTGYQHSWCLYNELEK